MADVTEAVDSLTEALDRADNVLAQAVSYITENIQAAEGSVPDTTYGSGIEVDRQSLERVAESRISNYDTAEIAQTLVEDLASAIETKLDEIFGDLPDEIGRDYDEVEVDAPDFDGIERNLRNLHSNLEQAQNEMEETLGDLREALGKLQEGGVTPDGAMIYLKFTDGEWTVCDPAVDHVGLTEQQAAERVHDISAGEVRRLQAEAEARGFEWLAGMSCSTLRGGEMVPGVIESVGESGETALVKLTQEEDATIRVGLAYLERPAIRLENGRFVQVGNRVTFEDFAGGDGTLTGIVVGATEGHESNGTATHLDVRRDDRKEGGGRVVAGLCTWIVGQGQVQFTD